jgi:rsbT co-antagonist protein RsbR
LIPLALFIPQGLAVLGLLAIGLIAYATVLALARRGHVTAGGWLMVAMLTLGTLSGLAGFSSSSQFFGGIYFLVLPLLVSSLVLRPTQIWVVLALVLIGIGVLVVFTSGAMLPDPVAALTFFSTLLLLIIVALLGFLSGKSVADALAEARATRLTAESTAAELARINAELELRVDDRTTALRSALAEVELRAEAQARLLDENQQQREAIRDLSVPVLPVNDSTLVMPLVGSLDGERLALAQDQALNAIERAQARYLVLDITGVPLVDSHVAQGVFGVVQAARLLGTEVVLVGVRPEVAQSLVGLGVEMRGIRTFSDLRSAIGGVARVQR